LFDDKTQTLCSVIELADAGDIQKNINNHQKDKTHQMIKGLKALH
jgi:hypothetical protein